MNETVKKIIDWAAYQCNAYGTHITALDYAIDNCNLETNIIAELKKTKSEWVNEYNLKGDKQS